MRTLSIAAMQTAPIARDPDATLDLLAKRAPAVKAAVPHAQLLVLPELHLSALPGAARRVRRLRRFGRSVPARPPHRAARRDRPRLEALDRRRLGLRALRRGPHPQHRGRRVSEGRARRSLPQGLPRRPTERSVPGDGFVTFDIPGVGRLGLAICYDGSFPEAVRELAWLGAELVVQPTLTTTSDPRPSWSPPGPTRSSTSSTSSTSTPRSRRRWGEAWSWTPRGSCEPRRGRGRSCSPTCSISRRWSGCGGSA